LDTLNAEEKVKLKEIIGKAVNIETEAKAEVAKINDIAAQLAGNKEGEEAIKTIQTEAQDNLTVIEALRKEVEAIVLTKNAEVFLEQVQEAAKTAEDELAKVQPGLDTNTIEGFAEAKAAAAEAEAAAKVAEEGLDKLKGTAHEGTAKTAAEAARKHANDAKQAYDAAVEAKLEAILAQVKVQVGTAKAEAANVENAFKATTVDFAAALGSLKAAEAAVEAAAEEAKKLAGTHLEPTANQAVIEAQAEVTKAREAYDTHPEAKNYVILEQVQEAAKTAEDELAKVQPGLDTNTIEGFTEAKAAAAEAEAAAKVAEEGLDKLKGTAYEGTAKTAAEAARKHANDAKQACDAAVEAKLEAILAQVKVQVGTAKAEAAKVQPGLDTNTIEGFAEAKAAVEAAVEAAEAAALEANKLVGTAHETAANEAVTEARTAVTEAKEAYIAAVTPKIQELLTEFNGDDKGVSVVAKQIEDVRAIIKKKHTKGWYTEAKKAIDTAKTALQAAKDIVDKLAQVAIAEDEAQKEASTRVKNAKDELNKVIDDLNADAKNHSVTTDSIEKVK